jgi:hypothetical protein
MDTKKLLEMLKKDLKKWTPEQLSIALEYCDGMCQDMDQKSVVYAWWYDLRKDIQEEIDFRRHV